MIVTGSLWIFACGKTSVTIDESTYEPKIVIDAVIYPNKPIENIRIKRNFPVGSTISYDNINLPASKVWITHIDKDTTWELSYNWLRESFSYPDSEVTIEYETEYRLDVEADIDGNLLRASSTTLTPGPGFYILADSSISGSIRYRQKDANGNLIYPRVVFHQAESAEFYLLSLMAQDASPETFIEDNSFGIKLEDVLDDGATIKDFQYSAMWAKPNPDYKGYGVMEISWRRFWFYGIQRIWLYAGDKNFYHFYRTHQFVQEADGNLHEPIFEIEGDGIGLFGSAVRSVLYFELLQ